MRAPYARKWKDPCGNHQQGIERQREGEHWNHFLSPGLPTFHLRRYVSRWQYRYHLAHLVAESPASSAATGSIEGSRALIHTIHGRLPNTRLMIGLRAGLGI